MSGKGIPIAEPINGAIFLSKSNPGPKRDAKRNKRKGVNSPFDHVNDRKKQDFRGSSSTSKTSPHFVEVASPNKSDVLLPQSADMPLLNAGLSKFTTQRAFTSFPTAHTLQGQAAINRLAASSSGQKRPVTAHGRPEPPKLKFESPQSSAKEEVQFIEPQRQTARERMHTKSASITPIPRKTVSPDRGKALASYYVEHAWSQIVGSDENFKIPLFTDARMYFYTNFIDLNFRDDSPMYGKSIRELMVF